MHKIFSLAEQHRRDTGNHINWLDNRQGNQLYQNEQIVGLSRNAGDAGKRNQAQTLLQLLTLLTLIQNTNMSPAPRGFVTKKTDEYSLATDQPLAQGYRKKALPVPYVMEDTQIKPQDKRRAKRHIEMPVAQRYINSQRETGKPKLFVLVKKDFHQDVDENIYKLAMLKSTPGEIASIRRLIKQNRLRENGALATEETTQLVKMFDDYVIYKAALNNLQYSLTRKAPKSLLLEKATELYGVTGDSKEVEQRRLALKVQLYHLEKLAKNKFDIVFRPFLLTSNPKNSDEVTYEAIESELAGQLIEEVVVSSHGVPENHTITYGPAYQARKSFIAYALYVYGIHSAEQLAIKNISNKLLFYKELLSSLEIYMKENDDLLLDEIGNHFYFSLYNYYLANPDVSLDISNDKHKKLSKFNNYDKIDALIYHFNSDIEVKYKPQKRLGELFLFVAQEFLFSSSVGKNKIFSKPVFLKNKLAGNAFKQTTRDKNIPNAFGFIKSQQKGKGSQKRIKKPRRNEFPDDATYQQEKIKYDQYIKERVALRSNYDRERRRKIAADKLKKLEKTHAHKVIQESSGGFTLTTAQNNRGKIVVLSAHAWSERYTNPLRLPQNKKLYFLGPDGKVLLEAPEKDGLLPTSYLVASKKYPAIFSTFTEEGMKLLANKGPQARNIEQAKNYRLKHYDTTPDEEVKLAVIENRLKVGAPKMDFLTVDELAGEKKLSDVMNLMKKNKLLQDYDKVIFYACREVKKGGVMKLNGLKDAYEINFVDIPLSVQVAVKRSLSGNIADNRIYFDGYYIYERFEVEKDRVTPYVEGITPYRNL